MSQMKPNYVNVISKILSKQIFKSNLNICAELVCLIEV